MELANYKKKRLLEGAKKLRVITPQQTVPKRVGELTLRSG